jgi:hypothetical protein
MTRRRGQSLVESALILVAFMGLLLGIAGISESLFVRQTLADRARSAARWGALNHYDPARDQSKIRDMVLLPVIPASDIEISNPGCPGAQCRIVVAIPSQGIRSTEPVSEAPVTAEAPQP